MNLKLPAIVAITCILVSCSKPYDKRVECYPLPVSDIVQIQSFVNTDLDNFYYIKESDVEGGCYLGARSVEKDKTVSLWIKSCAAIGDGSSMLISANYVAEVVSGILPYKDTDYIQSSPSMEKINKCIH